MEDNGIDDSVAIKNFHLIVKPELRGPIEELQGQHSVSWRNFKVALKAEYFLEDFQRVTKQTFIKWVRMKNKGLTSSELLREFEKKFDQLSTGEQQSLRSEKVELFVQAADSRLQKSLLQLLEDPAGELGLINDWDAAPATINLLVKRQKRIDKSIVVDSHEDFEENGIVEKIVEKPKASSSPTLEGKEKPKATQSSTLDDSTMDDLIKDSRLQKSLVQLLEDPAGELGLTNDWDVVPTAINLLLKRQKRIDKSIVVDSHEDFEENGIVEKIVEKPKASSSPTLEVEQETNPTNSQNILYEELEDLEEPRVRMENDVVLEAKHAHFHEDEESDEVPRSHFLRSHWARATTETVVKIADFEGPILALVDHGSEINLMSKTLYQK
ncbi:hypothetical protein L7F22_003567 [Adiantum nelumboides]|nr:hypothetical protein [Adiantum nelumboides]